MKNLTFLILTQEFSHLVFSLFCWGRCVSEQLCGAWLPTGDKPQQMAVLEYDALVLFFFEKHWISFFYYYFFFWAVLTSICSLLTLWQCSEIYTIGISGADTGPQYYYYFPQKLETVRKYSTILHSHPFVNLESHWALDVLVIMSEM